MAPNNGNKSVNLTSLAFLVLYFVGALYNARLGNTFYLYLWSGLFLVNLVFFLYRIFANKNKNG